jgi:chromosome segregation ATPase
LRDRLAKEEADRRSTEVRTIFRSAQGRLAGFECLDSSAACDRCGQPVTPEHYAAEARRLREERDDAERCVKESDRLFLDAQDRARSAESTVVEAERIARKADADLAGLRRELAQAEADASMYKAACAKAFGDLDDSFRSAIATGFINDWATTTYPTSVDLAEGRRLRDGLAEAESLARQARTRLEAMKGEQWQLEEARRCLDTIGLRPGDEQAEDEHFRLAEEVASLDLCLKTHRLDQASAESTIDEVAKKIDRIRGEIEATSTPARCRSRMSSSLTERPGPN